MKTKTKENICVKSLQELTIAADLLLDFKEDNKIFAFFGAMGSGKTSFIKAICRKLGVESNVTSPTFSIVNEYLGSGNSVIYHFDFYRIKNELEAFDIGFEDYIYSGNLCFIEWPEKIAGLLPEKYVCIEITEDDRGYRLITFQK
ncbi:MAG: tRNA (adenosine(37)-N6)-threonylcarbamoyltransferase complex ATPase subunit type 1 TsaE [Bacteroidetes bacterium]|nr:tRNA (adenosine(37)-N6)-threonylcarbamoyltransferase complex ATPase subunit type 1 TsaE [Bacteroidota bacterium]HET6245776.1 tRNA (adenosine(37)-N6)-threonylcarbamoyltransferase complex ATPase subunit type 1 TsaE [Bacteroidia bacterium]